MKIKSDLVGNKLYQQKDLPLQVELLQDRKVNWHRHLDFYELVIVCSGKAKHSNNIRTETIHAGHVFLMPEKTIHRYSGFNNFRYYNLLFHHSLLDIKVQGIQLESLPGYNTLFNFQFTGENRCSKLLTIDKKLLSNLVEKLSELHQELTLKRNGWKESAYFIFMQILVCLLRESQSDSTPEQNIFPIGNAIRVLEQDCTKMYPVKKLAESVGMSVSCFRHNFTRITGLPPREYLLQLRLKKAILLLNGSASISEIARQTGFQDNNYFSRIITKRFGCSPRKIRQKYNSGELTPEVLLEKNNDDE